MGNLVQCKCVLKKAVDTTRTDHLYLAVPPDLKLRVLPCRKRGMDGVEERGNPEWRYEDDWSDGLLHLTPSMLSTDTGFHTDFNWSCPFEVCPENVSGYDHFYAINPDIHK